MWHLMWLVPICIVGIIILMLVPKRSGTANHTATPPTPTPPIQPTCPPPASHGGGGLGHDAPIIRSNHPNTTWAGWVNAILALIFFVLLVCAVIFVKDGGIRWLMNSRTKTVVILQPPQTPPKPEEEARPSFQNPVVM